MTDSCNLKDAVVEMKCNEYVWETDKWAVEMEGTGTAATEKMETCYKVKDAEDKCTM